MKKIFVLLCAQLVMLSAFAQDVIITKDAQKIPAKVTDIEDAVIKYKKYDNLDGPTYTMKKSEIATLMLENGSVEVFTDQQESANTSSIDGIPAGEVKYVTRKMGEVSGFYYGGTITQSGFFVYEGASSMNSNELARALREHPQNLITEAEYMEHIRSHCPEAYAEYKRGYALGATGTVFLAVGLSAMICSWLFFLSNDIQHTGIIGWGATFGGGAVLSFASIPLYSVAYKKMRVNSADIYNTRCANRTNRETSFNFGPTRGGLGIYLQF